MEINTIIAIASALTAGTAQVISAYRYVRAKKYKDALDLADDTLITMISAVEAWGRIPGNEAAAASLKKDLQDAATAANVQAPKLAPLVEIVVSRLESLGILKDYTATGAAKRAVEIARARRAEKKLTAIIPHAVLPLFLLIMALSFTGCASTRQTSEILVPGDPPEIVITWPANSSAAPDDYQTFLHEGRMVTVAPQSLAKDDHK
ncbi:hypothetical protein GC173_11545 [bacterium]|nr:hypothetical protein [bacterium]